MHQSHWGVKNIMENGEIFYILKEYFSEKNKLILIIN